MDKIKIAFQGEKGAYSHIACEEIYRDADIKNCATFEETFKIAFEDENIRPIVITEQHKTREQLARYILEHKIAKGAKLLIEIRAQGNYKLTLLKK